MSLKTTRAPAHESKKSIEKASCTVSSLQPSGKGTLRPSVGRRVEGRVLECMSQGQEQLVPGLTPQLIPRQPPARYHTMLNCYHEGGVWSSHSPSLSHEPVLTAHLQPSHL